MMRNVMVWAQIESQQFIQHVKKSLNDRKGQGVIEYAGALVIAAVMVSTVLAIGPSGVQTLFNTILTSVQTFFTNHLSTLK